MIETQRPVVTREGIQSLVSRIVPLLEPFCQKIEVCGSFRRGLPQSHDLDIVVLPNDGFAIWSMLIQIDSSPVVKKVVGKYPTYVKYELTSGIPMEIYLAKDETQFEVLKLVRTGDWMFNRNLCFEANLKNLSFRFSGSHWGVFGLVRQWPKDKKRPETIINPIPRSDALTERQIIEKILGKYVDPVDRTLAEEDQKPEEDIAQEETDRAMGVKMISD